MLTHPLRMDSDWEYRLGYHASVANRLRVRALVSQTSDGPVNLSTVIDTAHAGDRASEITRTTTGGLWLHGIGVSIASPVERGQAYVSLALADHGNVIALLSGYIYDGFAIVDGVFGDPLDGPGFLRTVSLGDPAAGSDYAAEPVPANARWKIRAFQGTVVNDANGANRFVNLIITDGTNELWRNAQDTPSTASQTRQYVAHVGFGNAESDTNTALKYQTLPKMSLPAAAEFQVATTNIQVGDNWGEGFITVEEWLEP